MPPYNRRKFIAKTAATTAGIMGLGGLDVIATAAMLPAKESLYMIGPVPGYTPQIGTLVSMLNYNRYTVVSMVKSLTQAELDYLHDSKANTIGAMLLHLAATEKFYQINTFEGRQDFDSEERKLWGGAMDLGDAGRQQIKGHDVQFYLDVMTDIRQHTLQVLRGKNDDWLLAVDPEWSDETPLNTYWKWFHVCEHEANHRGQIAWLKGRLPGAKLGKE